MKTIYWLMAWLLIGQVFADTLFNAQGYRDKYYRRPTPATIDVAQTLTPRQLHQLMASDKPVLIDVLSVVVRPESAEFGFAWLPNEVRMNIPDSTWLPNVGYGKLDERMQDYFADNLYRLTQGNKNRALVFYCVEGCWMSWNAVKRAHSLGYTNLYWYPAGTDGWKQAGYKLAEATPYPIGELADPALEQQPKTFFATGDVDLQSILAQAQSKNRLIMLFFESETCPFCQRMYRVVLNQPSVIQAAHTDFIPVSIYIDKDSPMKNFTGQPISQRAFSRQSGIAQTPTILFLDRDQQILHKHTGLIATPREFNRLLQFVHSGAFTEQSWRVYKRP
jgi:PQQ-dependent catabolism-associated CXXCW motif protein